MAQIALTDRRSVVVSTLGITQTLAWGSTYYLTAVFADPVSTALGLPRVWFFGIFSAALLLSGLLGPLAGRTIDRYGGRDVLTATNLVFAAGLVAAVLRRRPDRPGGGLEHPRHRHGLRPVRGGIRHGRRPVWPRCAQLDHRHHAVRRFRQHGRLADQRHLHRCVRLARRLPGVGGAAPADRAADEPAAGAENAASATGDDARAGSPNRRAVDHDRPGQRLRRHLVRFDGDGGTSAAAVAGDGLDAGDGRRRRVPWSDPPRLRRG